ncbi:hypothetical protein SBA1_1370004 [Candidatus Sulfotelmatobacter kueseliae]|uniref:Uncharacterized protein n=1 Tax=Candidatus Sulfotelmatobacter kueseliae TaxID=2042962 RepID=A0A2U3K5Z1_9BACT|nr:hypothetical protein SBA1_1370004 [Candidatus Sulfotelmatobacter kueseliae]
MLVGLPESSASGPGSLTAKYAKEVRKDRKEIRQCPGAFSTPDIFLLGCTGRRAYGYRYSSPSRGRGTVLPP